MSFIDAILQHANAAMKDREVLKTCEMLNTIMADKDPTVSIVSFASLAALYTHVFYGDAEEAQMTALSELVSSHSEGAIRRFEEKKKEMGL